MTDIPYRMAEDSKYPYATEEDEDDEEEVGESGYKTVKDAVLFAIDVSESMLTVPSDSDPKKLDTALSPTLAALKCAYALMQQRIISNPNDMMGILLFGTKKSKFREGEDEGNRAGLQYPHCYLLTDLDVPAAADVKQLRTLVDDEEEAADLLQASSEEEVSMANVLFCANQIFTTKAPNFSSRRLFLVTDNDYPHASDRNARNSAAVRAKDMYDLGVTIELFPISHPDRDYIFDRNKFYNDIVYSATPSDPDAPAPLSDDIKAASSVAKDGISLLQSLISSVNSRAAPRRAIFSSVPFEIGPGLKISIKGFILIKRQEPKRTTYVYLPPDSDKAQIAVGSSTLVDEDTARTVEKVEIRKAFKFGGETISLTEEELAEVKKFGDTVLRIIGFKPMSLLPMWASVDKCTFIYPSEDGWVGSTRVFSALHQKLLQDDKMGLAWYIPRKNAVPKLVAIIPGVEERNEEGEQKMPPGLWLKPLPWADDIREAPETNLVRAPDKVVDAMRIIVEQLQLPKAIYDPYKYPNPSLQWFYRILQALALEEDLPEQPDDKTLPKWKQIHKRAGGYVIEWGGALDEAFEEWQTNNQKSIKPATNGGSKRTAPASSAPKTKKVKEEDDDEGVTDAQMRGAYDGDKIGKFKNAELKAWLQSKNLRAGAKKQDMVDAVTSYFETKMETD
ncbi:ATP-dependent DNA helicase II subunit 1 [Fulvia fulva]|uniref:ATP-dependent DNA helicase II subunit 1 n=1 Tax=Passalora fulva TaxID=5499 RepID=A0A9Q8P9G4_PASFU|nr:ATP-dependent DNA helicase II subunit 1 [Fulvia fulva]KAK4624009.1 ATP-dependent DNA helicase II subunit 1 [Fulvia fulva]KAK4625340.1 ATP-dependent DNA helicase II subunit 1 [Fulvia fulva]UJO18032.1 ATP-dependent DNA helicase II subunit 1 [Fulvia fulva]WPV14673.1 ATP-dependent DNA helicase II subunit 1 [Fulvia fulva]WPV30119.1 ATP-dependent DNA helicase II subunit 1 [Fulvia fulva]